MKKIIKMKQVKDLTGLSRSSIYLQMHALTFPKSIKLSERAMGWLESDIQGWIDGRIAASQHA